MPSRRSDDLAPAVVRADGDHGRAELVADPAQRMAWTLLVDGTSQSYVDLADPTHLEFEYVRRIGHLLDALEPPPPAPLHVLHLGGGAWTLPRYVAATRPLSVQRVVELDGALVELVRTRLPADGLGLDVHVDDARAALAAMLPGTQDAVVLDVFAGARTPAHLTSVEFLTEVARVLRPDGVYVANLADGVGGSGGSARRPLDFARAQTATAAAVFDEVAVVAAPDVLRLRRFGNLVLAATRGALPLTEVARRVAGDPFPARVLSGSRFARGAVPVVDATAAPSPLPPPGRFGR